MKRKRSFLSFFKLIIVLGIVFFLAIVSYRFYTGSEPLTYSFLTQSIFSFTVLFVVAILYYCRKISADLRVLTTFLHSNQNYDEIDLRKLKLREFEDLGVMINCYAEKVANRFNELSRVNDTLSIDVNKRGRELALANEQLKKELVKHEEMERNLERALKTAESANRAKSEFLSNMRHEIRTPMNAIIGMTDLVLDSEISSRQKELLTIVRESGQSLLKVINEILDLAKLDSDEIVLSREMFVLEDTVEVTVRRFEEDVERKGLEMKTFLASNVPGMVSGDYSRLTKVLYSLVDNAVKFTDRGTITISVELEEEIEDELILHFSVSDTGIGIDEDKRDSIFIPFSQVDGSYTRQFEGTGLGLTIAARTVEKMGGIMWLDEAVVEGSTFHFIVRLGKASLPGFDGN